MFRRLALLLLRATSCVAASGELAEAPHCVALPADPRPDCIEAVVLARFLEYRPTELGPLAEDEIVMSWTWDVDIDVRKVYLGDIPTGKLTIGATLHTKFDPELLQPVLFLTRRFDTWYLSYIEFAARDASGRMVVPLFDAPGKDELSPNGWMPRDFEKWLKRVRYRDADVAGFSQGYDEPDSDDEWTRVRGQHRTAKRGFRLEDIPEMLAERRAVECAREAPSGVTARS